MKEWIIPSKMVDRFHCCCLYGISHDNSFHLRVFLVNGMEWMNECAREGGLRNSGLGLPTTLWSETKTIMSKGGYGMQLTWTLKHATNVFEWLFNEFHSLESSLLMTHLIQNYNLSPLLDPFAFQRLSRTQHAAAQQNHLMVKALPTILWSRTAVNPLRSFLVSFWAMPRTARTSRRSKSTTFATFWMCRHCRMCSKRQERLSTFRYR